MVFHCSIEPVRVHRGAKTFTRIIKRLQRRTDGLTEDHQGHRERREALSVEGKELRCYRAHKSGDRLSQNAEYHRGTARSTRPSDNFSLNEVSRFSITS